MSPWRLRQISRHIHKGAVFAYPTDTIWGLGCHPLCAQSIQRIHRIKQRPPDKSFILLSSRLEYYRSYIDEDLLESHYERLSTPQPRPVTWIVRASHNCPGWLAGQDGSIAIRITYKPLIKILCDNLQSPVISTSANISGRPACRNSLQVHKYFHAVIDYIIQGFDHRSLTGNNIQASQIRSLQSNKIFRP